MARMWSLPALGFKVYLPMAAFVLLLSFSFWEDWTYSFFASGETVSPTERAHIVFAEDEGTIDSYRCSASTTTGDQLSLPRYDGPRPQRSTGGRAGHRFWAVADLPVDKGPLTVSCPGNPRLWLAMPHPPGVYKFMTGGFYKILTFLFLFVLGEGLDKIYMKVRSRREASSQSG